MVSREDIKAFWKQLPKGEEFHPDDFATLRNKNPYQQEVKPGPWFFNIDGARLFLLRSNPGFVSDPDFSHERRGGGLYSLWERKLSGEDVEVEMHAYNERNRLNCYEWVRRLFGSTIHSDSELIQEFAF